MFESTIWHVIHKAKSSDPEALNEFANKYRGPVRSFIRLKGYSEDEAEDLSQEVFLRIFKDGVLEKADQVKGRFRSLLLAVTKHVLLYHRQQASALKRGGDQTVTSLDQLLERGEAVPGADEQDETFDREWMRALLHRAMADLQKENELYHRVLTMVLEDDKTYREIADAVKKTEVDIWNYVRAGKRKLITLVRKHIAEYSSSKAEFQSEAEYLARYFDGS